MAQFDDPFPTLSQSIDVGGDRYHLGVHRPVELAYKSRNDFLHNFGSDLRTEYLLRKYLPSTNISTHFTFDNPHDKKDLLSILQTRAKSLQLSKEFTSSTLKNTMFQRIYLEIQDLIETINGTSNQTSNNTEHKTSTTPSQDEEPRLTLSDDIILQLLLEISWFLLHPEEVPTTLQKDWNHMISELDTLRLGDFMAQLRKLQEDKKQPTNASPMNYFSRINVGKVARAPTRQNALDLAKQMATEIQDDLAKESMKERLKTLLHILEAKKYLNDNLPRNNDRLAIIDSSAANSLSQSIISNPLRGGSQTILHRPLRIAMNPLFEYFRSVYDPIYRFLEENVLSFLQQNDRVSQKKILPQLLTLLHLCQNIQPSESTEGGQHTYGIYRITNVDTDLLSFITSLLDKTTTHIESFQTKEDKNTFQKLVRSLPQVRLSSLINPFAYPNAFKDSITPLYLQFFVVGKNLTLPTKKEFVNLKKVGHTEQMHDALASFFQPTNLYLLVTKEDTTENIPLHIHTIDFSSIDVAEPNIKVDIMTEDPLSSPPSNDIFLNDLVQFTPYIICNDAEIALSTLIALKERMPM